MLQLQDSRVTIRNLYETLWKLQYIYVNLPLKCINGICLPDDKNDWIRYRIEKIMEEIFRLEKLEEKYVNR